MNPEVHPFSLEIKIKWAGTRHEVPQDGKADLASEGKEDECLGFPQSLRWFTRGQEEACSQTFILSDEPGDIFKWMTLKH